MAARRYDVEDYEGRNVVERLFNRMKDWRGPVSSYKYALVHRKSFGLAATVDWLR